MLAGRWIYCETRDTAVKTQTHSLRHSAAIAALSASSGRGRWVDTLGAGRVAMWLNKHCCRLDWHTIYVWNKRCRNAHDCCTWLTLAFDIPSDTHSPFFAAMNPPRALPQLPRVCRAHFCNLFHFNLNLFACGSSKFETKTKRMPRQNKLVYNWPSLFACLPVCVFVCFTLIHVMWQALTYTWVCQALQGIQIYAAYI